MLQTRRTISTKLPVLLIVFYTTITMAGQSQQATGGNSGPNYKIIDGTRFILIGNGNAPISLATDQNFTLEDITPCLIANQSSPAYSCTDAEKSGTVNSLHVVYSRADCTASQVEESGAMWSQLTCRNTISGIAVTGKILQRVNQNGDLIVLSNQPTLLGGRLYRFTYWTLKKDQSGNSAVSMNQVSLDTRPVVTMSIIPTKQSGMNQVILSSPLSFSQGGMLLRPTSTNCLTGAGRWQSVTLQHTGAGTDLQGQAFTLQPFPSPSPTNLELLSSVRLLGRTDLCLAPRALATPFTPTPGAAGSVIQALAPGAGGGPVTAPLTPGMCAGSPEPVACAQSNPTMWSFADGTKLVASLQQPTGKSDSVFYANINMVAGTGAKFAWGLDGKLAILQRKFIGNSSITWLSATANVGNNTSNIKSQTYSDSIDWTLPISYDWRSWPGTFVFAPDYNTDIEFDRQNMFADIHVMWTAYFHPLAWNTALESGADAKYSSTSIKPGVGGRFYLQGGMEAGGAMIDTVQKASSGNAKIIVPAYNIARIVPQLHGILEWKPAKGAGVGVLTFDNTFTGRDLLTTENTVEQFNIPASGSTAATVGLKLQPISGWKAYNSFITTWYPPHSANAGLGITYNDGFNTPKFSRVNTVTIGLTILF